MAGSQLKKEMAWHLMGRCKGAREQALAPALASPEKQTNFTQTVNLEFNTSTSVILAWKFNL